MIVNYTTYGTYAKATSFTLEEPENGKVVIADTYEGLPVTRFTPDSNFKNYAKDVYVPDSIEGMSEVFEQCPYLEKLSLPYVGSVKEKSGSLAKCDPFVSIFENAVSSNLPYRNSFYRAGMFYYDGKNIILGLTANVPESLKELEIRYWKPLYHDFHGCESIEKITLPEVDTIKESSFNLCYNLKEIIFSEGLNSIEERAFENCKKLEHLNFPKSLKRIYYEAFLNCTNLTTVTFPEDSNLIYLSGFNGCSALSSISIPDTVTDIGGFSNCKSLTELILPEGLIKINSNCFENCSNLHSINIPNSVEFIGKQAFTSVPACTSDNYFTYIGNWLIGVKNNDVNLIIPDNILGIAQEGLVSNYCTNVTLGKSIKYLNNDAIKCNKGSVMTLQSWPIQIDNNITFWYGNADKWVFNLNISNITDSDISSILTNYLIKSKTNLPIEINVNGSPLTDLKIDYNYFSDDLWEFIYNCYSIKNIENFMGIGQEWREFSLPNLEKVILSDNYEGGNGIERLSQCKKLKKIYYTKDVSHAPDWIPSDLKKKLISVRKKVIDVTNYIVSDSLNELFVENTNYDDRFTKKTNKIEYYYD